MFFGPLTSAALQVAPSPPFEHGVDIDLGRDGLTGFGWVSSSISNMWMAALICAKHTIAWAILFS